MSLKLSLLRSLKSSWLNIMDPQSPFLFDHVTHFMCCLYPHSWKKLGWPRDRVHNREIHYNWATGDFGSRYLSLTLIFLLPGHLHLWALDASFLNWREDVKYVKVGVEGTKWLLEVLFSPWNLWLLILSHTRVSSHICMHGSAFPSLKWDIFSCCLNYF